MTELENPVLLATIGGAHGIRGECRVRSFTADPTDVGAYGPLVDKAGVRYTVASARLQKTVVIVRSRRAKAGSSTGESGLGSWASSTST